MQNTSPLVHSMSKLDFFFSTSCFSITEINILGPITKLELHKKEPTKLELQKNELTKLELHKLEPIKKRTLLLWA